MKLLFESKEEIIKKLQDYNDELDTAIVDKFLEVVEGRSTHSEKDQRKYLLIAFYATLPDLMPTHFTLEMMIIDEGWDKKSLEDMIKYYAPSTISNYKQMGKIPRNYFLP